MAKCDKCGYDDSESLMFRVGKMIQVTPQPDGEQWCSLCVLDSMTPEEWGRQDEYYEYFDRDERR